MKTIQRRWFHGTTKEAWKKIKKEGLKPNEYGELFLAGNQNELIKIVYKPAFWHDLKKCEVLLSVKYTPNGINDDYDPKNWEMIVNKPIPINNVRVLRKL